MTSPRDIDDDARAVGPKLLYWRNPDDPDEWGPPDVGSFVKGEWYINGGSIAVQPPDGWLPLPDVA